MKTYDVLVIGAGPAGLAAALNAAVRNKQVLLMGPQSSAKLSKAAKISNYLGLPDLSGATMLLNMHKHLERYPNVDFLEETAQVVYRLGDKIGVLRENNDIIEAWSLVLATGINFGHQLPGEAEFTGKGVGTCATCDAALYKGKPVIVVGYSDHSVEEANFIGEMASSTLFVNQTGKEVQLADQIMETDREPAEIQGKDRAEKLVFKDGSSEEAAGIFVIRDAVKAENLVPGLEMDGVHVRVNREMQTNLEGIFACGDLVGRPYQLQVACGRGQLAGLEAAHFASQAQAAARKN